jgi:hypothetical protein
MAPGLSALAESVAVVDVGVSQSVLVRVAHACPRVALDQGTDRKAGLMHGIPFSRIAELTEYAGRLEWPATSPCGGPAGEREVTACNSGIDTVAVRPILVAFVTGNGGLDLRLAEKAGKRLSTGRVGGR